MFLLVLNKSVMRSSKDTDELIIRPATPALVPLSFGEKTLNAS
jgi:hypothetical protein